MKTVKSFCIGDHVTWESEGGGHLRRKTGVVVVIVPAGKDVADIALGPKYIWSNFGGPRAAESYLVAVGNRLYWPRVFRLESVEEAS